MDPITIGIAISAVSGLVQAYNSEQARGASKSELKNLEALFNSIIPPDYDLSITDPPELHEEKLALPQFSSDVALPKFNLDKLSPEKLTLVGKYVPEVAPYVAEAKSTTIQKTGDMALGRDAQKAALQRFQQIGAGEFDPEYQEAVTKASRAAQADAQSRQASILQDFARRGQSGSGLNLAAQLGGSAQAMDREAMTNLGAASESYRNRLNALSQGASLGGQIANADTDLQARNADIINSFNQRMSTTGQAWANNRANVLNDASRHNLGVEQGLANQNVANANEAARYNQGRQDDLTKYNYAAGVNQQARNDQNQKYTYGAKVDAQQNSNNLAMDKYRIAVDEKDRKNSLLAQQYSDRLSQAGLKAGAAHNSIANRISATRDINSAIGGLGEAGATYYQSQADRDTAKKSQVADDDRSYFEKYGQFMAPADRKKREEYY